MRMVLYRLSYMAKMALGAGFEPAIYGVKGRCPGPLDEPSKLKIWRPLPGSNRRHLARQASTLPLS